MPDLSLDSMLADATAGFQDFVMDPANADRAQTPNNYLGAAAVTAGLGFTRHALQAYVPLHNG